MTGPTSYRDACLVAEAWLDGWLPEGERLGTARRGRVDAAAFYVPLVGSEEWPGAPAGVFVARRSGSVEFVPTCSPWLLAERLAGMRPAR